MRSKIKVKTILYLLVAAGMFSSCVPQSKHDEIVAENEKLKKEIDSIRQEKKDKQVGQITGYFIDARDGKGYKTVKIGTQTWMAENLAYKADAGCWAYDNKESNVATYGYLYDWDTAKRVFPSGWHLPSDAEWKTLIDYLGGKDIACEKMKSTSGWNDNDIGTNSSRFSVLGSGIRFTNGNFYFIGSTGSFWSSTGKDELDAWYISLSDCDKFGVFRHYYKKGAGISIRCIQD